jgi:hypothetical protein
LAKIAWLFSHHVADVSLAAKQYIAGDKNMNGTQAMKDTHQEEVAANVARWQADGLWIDRGRWIQAGRDSKEYHPTHEEILAKCKLFRTTPHRHGAHARAPRGGEFAIAALVGI